MGIYDRDYYRDERRPASPIASFLPRTAVGAIIAINVMVWFLDMFSPETRTLRALPNGLTVVQPGRWLSDLLVVHVDTITHPLLWWKFLTAGFAHSPFNVMHIVGNMLVLFFLGRYVEERYGSKEFWLVYLATLVFANAVWSAVGSLAGELPWQGALGASGAISGMVVLFAFNYPHVTLLVFFVLPMPAWLVGVLIVAYDIYGSMGGVQGSNVAFLVHVAGAAFAAAYYLGGWNLSHLTHGGFRLPRFPFHAKPRLRVHTPDDREPDAEPPADATDLGREVDRILGKIYREGEASLTARERQTLETASREYQQRRK